MPSTLRSLERLVRLAILGAAVAVSAHARVADAVIIDTQSGLGNTTAPADDPGFANVGTRGELSGVYLGNRWVLTANHVGGGNFVLSSGTYAMAPGTGFQLTNPVGSGKSNFTDLYMYRLTADPGLPSLDIASVASGSGSAVTMIGNGLNRGDWKTWSVNRGTSPWIWTENFISPDAAGYQWGSGQAIRWGTNNVTGAGWINLGVDAYTQNTTFDLFEAYSSECQAAYGDSGGAVFARNGTSWQLAGIILGVNAYSGQPGSTAVYGNQTFFADLSVYRPQIVAVVPEPAAVVLAAVGIAFVLVRPAIRRRRAASAMEGADEA